MRTVWAGVVVGVCLVCVGLAGETRPAPTARAVSDFGLHMRPGHFYRFKTHPPVRVMHQDLFLRMPEKDKAALAHAIQPDQGNVRLLVLGLHSTADGRLWYQVAIPGRNEDGFTLQAGRFGWFTVGWCRASMAGGTGQDIGDTVTLDQAAGRDLIKAIWMAYEQVEIMQAFAVLQGYKERTKQ